MLCLVAIATGAVFMGLESRSGAVVSIDPTLEVEVNSAPAGVLLTLPAMGPSVVGRIVLERERGPYRSLDDFDARVRGVGPVTILLIRSYLRFGPEAMAWATPASHPD